MRGWGETNLVDASEEGHGARRHRHRRAVRDGLGISPGQELPPQHPAGSRMETEDRQLLDPSGKGTGDEDGRHALDPGAGGRPSSTQAAGHFCRSLATHAAEEPDQQPRVPLTNRRSRTTSRGRRPGTSEALCPSDGAAKSLAAALLDGRTGLLGGCLWRRRGEGGVEGGWRRGGTLDALVSPSLAGVGD